jgi:hypothetical protein
MTQIGMAPSNIDLRDILIPHLAEAPTLDDAPQGYILALRETTRFLEGRGTSASEAAEQSVATAVTDVARLLKGKSIVFIGGECKPQRKLALKRAFKLGELIWAKTKPGQSVNSLAPYVARPEVSVVLLAIRWSSHGFADLRHFCDRYQKPLVRLPGGYSVNQVAAHIIGQCGDRLQQLYPEVPESN